MGIQICTADKIIMPEKNGKMCCHIKVNKRGLTFLTIVKVDHGYVVLNFFPKNVSIEISRNLLLYMYSRAELGNQLFSTPVSHQSNWEMNFHALFFNWDVLSMVCCQRTYCKLNWKLLGCLPRFFVASPDDGQ